MRLWSTALAVASLLAGCGQGQEPAAAGESSTGAAASTDRDAADDSTTAEPEEPFDRSQCSTAISGGLGWSISQQSTVERGGGRDLARASEDSVYVVDGCLSRWSENGWREWEVLEPSWTCWQMDVDPQRGPVVVGRQSTGLSFAPLVAAFDPDGQLRWTMATGNVPPRPPPGGPQPEPADDRLAHDVVIDDEGRVFVAGSRTPAGGPLQAWVSRLDPDDGHVLWELEIDGGLAAVYPQLFIAGDDIVLAESRWNDAGIEYVELSTFDVDGTPIASWSSLDALGMPLRLVSVAGDHRGARALVGRDLSVDGDPLVLALLGSTGVPQWVRSGLDVPWLDETIATVAIDPCGSVVIAGSGDLETADWGNLWVAKVDLGGELRWSSFVPAPYFSRSTEVAAVQIEPDGGVLAAGLQITGAQRFEDDVVLFADSWLGRLRP